jgi:hypothetical protein
MDLDAALSRVAAGELDRLTITRLRDAAGSLGELVRLLGWLEEHGATLASSDPPLDTGIPAGRATVAVLREIAGWPPPRPPGRPGLKHADPALAERIAALRAEGLSLQAIADRLTADGVPTPRGGASWRPSSVQSALGYRRPKPPVGPPPPPHPGPPPPPGSRRPRGPRP